MVEFGVVGGKEKAALLMENRRSPRSGLPYPTTPDRIAVYAIIDTLVPDVAVAVAVAAAVLT